MEKTNFKLFKNKYKKDAFDKNPDYSNIVSIKNIDYSIVVWTETLTGNLSVSLTEITPEILEANTYLKTQYAKYLEYKRQFPSK